MQKNRDSVSMTEVSIIPLITITIVDCVLYKQSRDDKAEKEGQIT